MRIRMVAATLLAFGALSAPMLVNAATMGEMATPASTLTVTGHGQISRAPDMATVTATIVTSDDSATRALSENNRRFAALGAKLATGGISAADVTSTSIQSYFNPRPANAGANIGAGPFGFVVTRNVQINVNALTATGSVVDAATASGATQINGISYGFRDRRAVERAALTAAVNDAYAQAETIAGAAHVAIVRVLHIGDQASSPIRLQPLAMAMARSKEDVVPTTIAPSDLDVTASISITYSIR